jgi:hypothetical protein
MFLFTLSKVVTSTCTGDRPLEVVNEDFLEPLLGVDRVVVELSSHVSDVGSKAIGK